MNELERGRELVRLAAEAEDADYVGNDEAHAIAVRDRWLRLNADTLFAVVDAALQPMIFNAWSHPDTPEVVRGPYDALRAAVAPLLEDRS